MNLKNKTPEQLEDIFNNSYKRFKRINDEFNNMPDAKKKKARNILDVLYSRIEKTSKILLKDE